MTESIVLVSPWSLIHKALFRFVAIYFGLYTCCSMILVGDGSPLDELWNVPVTWAGRWLINRDYHIEVMPNGSGDTTFNYLQIFCLAVIAAIISVIWGIADRKRPDYRKLQYWLMVLLRYSLAISMLTYGMVKIIKLQFPDPYLFQLDQSLGNMSPMGLAWTYMGYSSGYNLFTGLAEFLAGCLLFFRKTRLLGALLCMGVMANVVAMNFSYDIPVKLFATHLFVIAGLIALPDGRRLLIFFFTTQPVPAANTWHPVYQRKWQRVSYLTVKIILVGFILYYKIASVVITNRHMPRQIPPLYGIYEINNVSGTLPDSILPCHRWTKIYMERGNLLIPLDPTQGLTVYNTTTDTMQHRLLLWRNDEDTLTLHYQAPEKGLLVLDGNVGADSVRIQLKRKDPNEFILISRGFHWINETPYNR